jgi:hypothetical protein
LHKQTRRGEAAAAFREDGGDAAGRVAGSRQRRPARGEAERLDVPENIDPRAPIRARPAVAKGVASVRSVPPARARTWTLPPVPLPAAPPAAA